MASRIAIIPKGVLSASSTSSIPQTSTNLNVELDNATALPFLKLPHPRTNAPALFLPFSSGSSVDIDDQILEVQAVNTPASRSWFTDDNIILEDGRLLLFTPIDPAFLLLPIIRLANPNLESSTFQTIDAIFEAASQRMQELQDETGKNVDDIVNYKSILVISRMSFIPSALSRICDCQELEDSTKVYRFSLPLTLKMFQAKIDRLSSPDMLASTRIIARSLSKDGLGPTEHVDDKLREAGRIKLSCDLLSQYLPPWIYQELLKRYDFKSLDEHVRSIQAADVGVSNVEVKGKSTAVGAKKRKADTQTSRGVQKLQKTDTSKMTKLTSFFQKKSTA